MSKKQDSLNEILEIIGIATAAKKANDAAKASQEVLRNQRLQIAAERIKLKKEKEELRRIDSQMNFVKKELKKVRDEFERENSAKKRAQELEDHKKVTDLKLGIYHNDLKSVEDYALENEISITESAKLFRDKILSLGLEMIFLPEFKKDKIKYISDLASRHSIHINEITDLAYESLLTGIKLKDVLQNASDLLHARRIYDEVQEQIWIEDVKLRERLLNVLAPFKAHFDYVDVVNSKESPSSCHGTIGWVLGSDIKYSRHLDVLKSGRAFLRVREDRITTEDHATLLSGSFYRLNTI